METLTGVPTLSLPDLLSILSQTSTVVEPVSSTSEKLRVPRETGVSERSRGNILAELGIDPVAAKQAYRAEIERRSRKRVYRCTRCEGEITQDEAKLLVGILLSAAADTTVCPAMTTAATTLASIRPNALRIVTLSKNTQLKLWACAIAAPGH